jgi:SpoVK/Ycf46/Vps4 family AAA+-type ATPase
MTRRNPDATIKPVAALTRSSDLRVLWILRVLIRLEGLHAIAPHSDGPPQYDAVRICTRLGIRAPRSSDPEAHAELANRLTASLRALEARAASLRLPATVSRNLDTLQGGLGLTPADTSLLAAAILMTTDDALRRAVSNAPTGIDPHRELATLLGLRTTDITAALGARGRLRRSGLLALGDCSNLAGYMHLVHPQLRRLCSVRLRDAAELVAALVEPVPAPTLTVADFRHLQPRADAIARFLARSIGERQPGINILLHGAPGNGKTELCRLLASATETAAYQVTTRAGDGRALTPKDRLARLATAQFIMGQHRGLLCFDEADALFEFGSSGQGIASVADAQKAWINELLETTAVPILWVVNRVKDIDPAFVRRCSLVIHVDTPPHAQRLAQLRSECGDLAPITTLEALASCDQLTPAVIARAARTVRQMKQDESQEDPGLLEAVLDGILRGQRQPPLRSTLSRHRPTAFEPRFCNSSEPLDCVLDAIRQAGQGRLCLHGPPGTGKSAFGRWLADRLGKRWLTKRPSDLLSPWLGETEQNLRRAFEQAVQERAVLQLDEIDSFLRDRGLARHGWEVTEVNEFLTQLECFDGVIVATTNRLDALDAAAARRFDWMIEFSCLRREQAEQMYRQLLVATGLADADDLIRVSPGLPAQLTPADFDAMQRRHRMSPFADAQALRRALQSRVQSRPGQIQAMGFV